VNGKVSEQEGVIKFQLDYQRSPAPAADTALLASWRTILQQLALLGQVPERYQGLGFGNLSQRQGAGFLITGSQTSGLAQLTEAEYAWVSSWDLANNRLVAQGQVPPSSESLTHAAIYAQNPAIQTVLHVHSPVIWRQATALGLAITDPAIAYGTPAMALAVQSLLADAGQSGVFAMGGHEDGVVAYGENCQAAGECLLGTLALAMAADSRICHS
jgi:hypothetical protein